MRNECVQCGIHLSDEDVELFSDICTDCFEYLEGVQSDEGYRYDDLDFGKEPPHRLEEMPDPTEDEDLTQQEIVEFLEAFKLESRGC